MTTLEARVDSLHRRTNFVQTGLIAALVLVSLFFNVLGYLSVQAQNHQLAKRAAENHATLQILKQATGPEAAHLTACFLNHIDVSLGKATPDPTCTPSGAPGSP